MLRPLLACALLLASYPALARPGDLGEPLVIPAVPFVHTSTTALRAAAIDRYSCASGTSEAGPEVVYRFDVPGPGVLSAVVDGDASPVDVDVHILSGLELDASKTAVA